MAANMKMLSTFFLISVFIAGNGFAAVQEDKLLSKAVILNTLTHMDLSGGGYTHVHKKAFSDFNEIVHLNLANNSIRLLPKAVFSSLKNLTHLNVSVNSMENTTNAFVGLNNLVDLDMSNNSLTVVGSNFFNGLTSQCRINLKNNKHLLIIQGDVFGSKRPKTRKVPVKPNGSTKSKKSSSKPVKIEFQACTPNSTFEELKISHMDNKPTNNCHLVYFNDQTFYFSLMNISSVKKGWYNVMENASKSANISGIVINEVKSSKLIGDFVNELPEYFQKVIVAESSIDRLTNGTFRHNGVVDLSLAFNEITVIETDAIDMPKLKTLSLLGNRLNNTDALKTLPATLKKLNLGSNIINALTTRSFSHLNNLTTLSLYRNNISTIDVDAFKNLDNLETLYLWKNKITDIEPGTFKLKNLKTLDLRSNRLRNISSLSTLPTTIENLLLGSNEITVITANDISHLKNLKKLSLYENRIATIELGAFKHLDNLETLYMWQNELTHINPGVFATLKIKKLDLGINRLNNISSLATLPSTIEILDLVSNNFTAITTVAMSHLKNLNELFISDNQISTIEVGAFKHLENLETLDLSFNRISKLQATVFNGLKNLEILRLDHNSLARIDAGIFDLPKLGTLDVSHNNVTAVAKGAFKNSPQLCALNIRENLINKLRNGELFGLQKLSLCYVAVTGIETLEGGVFDNV